MTADWQAYFWAGEDELDQAALQSAALDQLERDVTAHLRGSWCSQDKARLLLELVVLTQPAVCVEIGAFTGSTTLPMLAALRHVGRGRAYAVDPWSNEEAVRGLPSGDANTSWWSGVDMSIARSQFDAMVATWSLDPWCEVIAETSSEAVSRFAAIDLLHLDGNFSEEGAARDSEIYLPKVTAGGYVVLSNALVTIAGVPTKMKALWPLFDACEIACELDDGNTLLFRKN